MRTRILVVLALSLMAMPAAAFDWADVEPDAALAAHTVAPADLTLEGASWRVVTVGECSGWVDVMKPLQRPGLGLSGDWGAAMCVGGGYQADTGWAVYVGLHIR